MKTIYELYGDVVNTYLTANKKRIPYYEITYICDSGAMEFWSGQLTFSDAEMSLLLGLRDKYGKEFFNHLHEVFDEETLNEIAPNEIVRFDLDKPIYLYDFNIHQLTDEGLNTISAKIQLDEETYSKLIILHLADKNININSLKYANRAVYDLVSDAVDYLFTNEDIYKNKYPYMVTMEEAKEDALKIKELYPEQTKDTDKNVAYLYNGANATNEYNIFQ